MRLKIIIVTSFDLLFVIIVTFIIKGSKGTEDTCPKFHDNEIWICQISCDCFYFNTRCDYVIPSDFTYITTSA